MARNTTISIAKAIGIIAMVVGHAECPGQLTAFIFEWHMPLFFIAAGYFFNTKYMDDAWTFVQKRFKGLYVPFVKWSVIFLLLHNVFFEIGLLNEKYGNAAGGVLHPYNWHTIEQNLWNIVTQMSSYDQFICGAYWFFRALLVSSIIFLVLMILMRKILSFSQNSSLKAGAKLNAVLVIVIALLLAMWKCGEGLKVSPLGYGGYRELMGTFFFGIGFLFRQLEQKYRHYAVGNNIRLTTSTAMFFAITLLFSIYARAAMAPGVNIIKCISLPIPAIAGWLMVYNVSMMIDKCEGRVKHFLCYCGDHTLYIVLFHVLSYKVVSAIKIMLYGLDWRQIGCHMVIHEHTDYDCFWILYSIVGILLPLAFYKLTSKFEVKGFGVHTR